MIEVKFVCDNVAQLHDQMSQLFKGSGSGTVPSVNKVEPKKETDAPEQTPKKEESKKEESKPQENSSIMTAGEFRNEVLSLGKAKTKIQEILSNYCTSQLLKDVLPEKYAEVIEKVKKL